MVHPDMSCMGCHYNTPNGPPCPKFYQEVGYPTLEKHGYICQNDVTASAIIVTKFNEKSPRTPDQPRPTRPGARRASKEMGFEAAPARRVHPLSIPTTESPPPLPVESHVPLDPHETNLLLLPNQVAPVSLSNGYADL